jgi:hypothetical protein
MTRRSFCFLFGAGVAGAMLPSAPPFQRLTKQDIARLFAVPVDALDDVPPPMFANRPIVFTEFTGEPMADALNRIAALYSR